MQSKTKRALGLVLIIIGGLAIALAVYLWVSQDTTENTTKQANTEQSAPAEQKQPNSTQQYQSVKGVTVEIDNWTEGQLIDGPLTITGRVPGSWSFEGEFPIDLLYQQDISLPGTTAQLQDDWMTDDLVPFTAELNIEPADSDYDMSGEVLVILRKANPSGLPANDDSVGLKARLDQ